MIVKRGSETAPVENIDRLERVEVWDAAWGKKSDRKVRDLAPMNPDHFAERRAAGAFQACAIGRPVYYTRTSDGIEFHPGADRDYWFEPVFRKAT
jgi:hypothetical protein